MAKIAGRNAAIYLGTTTSAEASPLSYQNSWSMSFETEKIDVTSFGNTTKEYVAGIADSSGEFSGFYDDSSNQTLTPALDGLSRKLYLYPNTNTPTQYFFGRIFPDMSVNANVDGAVEMSSSWNAASPVIKVG